MISKRYEQMYQNEKMHWWYAGRRVLLASLIRTLQLPQSSQIVDIGCGTGFTLSLLSRYGKVTGVDKAESALAFCRKRGFTHVKKTDGKTLPFKKTAFDLVTCLDILEHIENENELLSEIKRVLKPLGYLIIFVPAFPFLWSDLDIRSQHYRRYDLKKLKSILKSSGFNVAHIGYFNYLFFIPILLVRLWQKVNFGKKKNSWGLDPVIGSNVLNKLLSIFFNFDVWSAPKLHPPFGVSMYAICKNN